MSSRAQARTVPVARIALIAALALPSLAAATDMDFDIWLSNVRLRRHVTVDLHVKVFVNERHPCHGNTILAVHGANGNAHRWDNFVEAIFAHNPTSPREVCRVAALEFPGHGQSGLPEGDLLFGELTLEDLEYEITKGACYGWTDLAAVEEIADRESVEQLSGEYFTGFWAEEDEDEADDAG